MEEWLLNRKPDGDAGQTVTQFQISRFEFKPTREPCCLMPVEAEIRCPALILNGVRELIRKYRWSFLLATMAGIGLRLLFIFKFPNINGDSLIYADIASNWLHHGTFALTESGVPVPTLIRLPGYPAFIAAIFYL